MILSILQARTGSTRLPGKTMMPLLGQPMLVRQVERVKHSKLIDDLVIATSSEEGDDAIEKLCREQSLFCFRGKIDDVLDRFYQAARQFPPSHVVRLTGDCPLHDASVIDSVIRYHLEGDYDYTSNALKPTYPDGLDVEVVRFEVLRAAWHEAVLPSEREHVTPFIWNNGERFKLGTVEHDPSLADLRWTVDEKMDFEFVTAVYERLYPDNPEFNMNDILDLLDRCPELGRINQGFARNEGYEKSLRSERSEAPR